MRAVHRTVIFFPIDAKEGSPLSGSSSDTIGTILECCLQQIPDVVKGYTLGGGDGRWFDKKSAVWRGDRCKVIEIYTSPGFASEFRNPTNAAASFLASLSYLSCVQMGHDDFFAIVGDQNCSGDAYGLHIGPNGKAVSYEKIFQSKFWLQLPRK